MLESMLQFLLLIPLIVLFLLKYYFNYWKRKGIPDVKPEVLDPVWYSNASNFYYFRHIYKQLEGHRFGGCFERFTPKLVVRDPDLIKHILIKDFDHFYDRGSTVFDKNEPITMHLFSAPGIFWKTLRVKLTPTFTSGKIKYMFTLIQECAHEVTEVLKKKIENEDDIDVNDYSVRYTIEVISSCAFGLKTDSIQNGKSNVKKLASDIGASNLASKFVFWTRSIFPSLKYVFKLKYINKLATESFFKLVENTMHYRKNNNIERNDFLQLLMGLKDQDLNKEEKEENLAFKLDMTTEVITAQCFLFFLAGFDTSSTVITLALLELAKNPQTQNKLQNEIDEYFNKYNENITYEMVKSMPYLHQVVSETLRMYPALSMLNRICTKRYQIPNSKFFIEKGTEVFIPVIGLHYDPQYFQDPERFDPDRFTVEEIAKRNNFVYLPFGDGPRNCIGLRFGLISVKLALINLLKDYTFRVSDKTPDSLKFKTRKVVTSVDHPLHLKCYKR